MRSLDEMLALSPWIRDLEPGQMARVRAATVTREFEAGSYVCRKDQRCDAWIGVIDGLVKLSCIARSGKSVTLAGITAGSWFGEGSVLKRERRKYDVVALRGSRIAFMPEATFRWLLDTSLSFNRFLILQLNERLGQFIGMVEHDRLLEPDARVARALAALFNPVLYPGSEPRIQISQEELGYLAGTSRQRVNQALHVLKKAGLVKVDYSLITVLDLDGLRSFDP
ncbi:MAG: Crp/Fnr family transcriptional regulator [Betaproteobacteria bacterium RIFCSPLOWO2_12_FULL_62_13]|nr:MAG: Crp/Fnr family transcriptional regulator [Betaproteobacteria bacterium RIFCSPLOWO2_12_FULL_62_13]